MAQQALCCLPSFGTTSDGPKRPVSTRVRTTSSQNAKLLSEFDEGKLGPVLKAAWGLLLHRYTGLEDVCFGYHYSGVDGFSEPHSLGSAKLLTCRLTVNERDSTRTILKRTAGKDGFESDARLCEGSDTNHDDYSLFNTVVMVRASRDRTKRGISVRPVPPGTLQEQCRIRLHVKVLREDICIFLERWNHEVSGTQIESVACYFEHLLGKILSDDDVTITELGCFLGNDWSRICRFNSDLPKNYERCIHEVIHEQSLRHPQREAVCAWDGSFTYSELDYLASKLACYLQTLGVGPEIWVALCFDKSKWNIVAMLGVLKAGGAFVPLDPTHPPSRLRSLVKSVDGGVMLCSRNRADCLSSVTDVLIPLDDEILSGISLPPGEVVRPAVRSDNAAYVIFTSGSTGQPKGTLLEHGAFVSSALAHGPAMDITFDSRILQFAAHTFDASLFESLTPLIHGGCVCVPSEEERLNDVVQAINRMKVNFACLTPSFVKFVNPSRVPGLKTLVLAGEAMSKAHMETWSKIRLVNGYGPTESAVCAAVHKNIHTASDCRDIGLPTGVRFWVVNPKDHNQLVPVGSPGELLLEGPTLARCYINNPQKTDEAFIYNPTWARNDSDSGDRRFYKTGDLVRYNSDLGSLTFIGRKDTQIKFHGQRIELGEIENNISSLPEIKHSLAFLSESGFAKGKIVTVVSLHGGSSSDNVPLKLLEPSKKSAVITELRGQLSTCLPTYMIPGIWLCVESLPLLPSGKLNRKEIVSWVTSMTDDPDSQVPKASEITTPYTTRSETTIEDRLASICSRVLNIPRSKIDLDEGFLGLGGDSIAAISCTGYCKKQGMGVTVQEVLQSKSIRDLATRVKEISQQMVYHEAIEKPFDLSPIQSLHFMVRDEGQGYFNQSISTRLNQQVSEHDLRRAIEKIVMRHSMLRARLVASGARGSLQQHITQDVDSSYRLQIHGIRNQSDMERAISDSQMCMNAFKGPVLAANLFYLDGNGCFLSMVAHHLVVDIVSWRIILEDLEDILSNPNGNASSTSSLPFSSWCHLQDERTQSLSQKLDDLPPPDLAYWGLQNQVVTYEDVFCETFELDSDDTRCILMDCHRSLQTEPIDLFVASLLHAFGLTFKDRSLPVIYNEGHGREVWDSAIDISRTVGWFTTLSPISVRCLQADDPVDTVIRVKDLRRTAADNGRQDFATRMSVVGQDGKPAHPSPMEITFNYVGQHRDLQRQDGLFQLINQMAGETGQGGGASDFGKGTPRFALFEISALAVNGKLRFTFSFSKHMRHQEIVRNWITSCRDLLQSLGKKLQSIPSKPTLSSFPMLSLTYKELDDMFTKKLPSVGVSSYDLIEDIYPCSRMQQGILIARSRDPALYAVYDTYQVRARDGTPDARRLVEAWRTVVSRHAMLRTLFVEGLTSRDLFCQVVLKSFDQYPIRLRCSDDGEVLATLNSQQPPAYNERQPQHRFTICETAKGKLFIRLELSHAAMDGVSISNILRDLQLAYDEKLDDQRPSFRNYMNYLRNIPQDASIEYWRTYLADVKPCLLPALSDGRIVTQKELRVKQLNFNFYGELRAICDKSGLTLPTAFSAAWGLTLRLFCGSNDVCFSYMASLRDAPVERIESIVGPIINLLPCRMRISEDNSLGNILQKVQHDFVQGLPHNSSSLIDIQHELKLSDTTILNTGISYRKLPTSGAESAAGINFSEFGTIQDPAEYPLFINVVASDKDANVELNYWTNTFSDEQAENVASIFLKCLQDITHRIEDQIGQLDKLSDWNKRRIRKWNKRPLEGAETCVQDVIREIAASHSDAPAITAWDGTLTYSSLDDLSSRLATYLTQLGVRAGTLVPIHFNKSVWQVATIVAVLKAGGICVPRDVTKKESTLDRWLVENGAYIALTSPSNAEPLEEIFPNVIGIEKSLFECLPSPSATAYYWASPSDDCYVVYTSEDTDYSTAVVLDQRAMLTRADAFASSLNLNSKTRTFQLAPYTSDVFLQELFGTLMRGGCLCIPEYDGANSLTESLNTLNASVISLTPSMASLLRPSELPNLEVLALFGETVTRDVKELWSEKVQLHSFFGATECSSTCIHDPNLDRLDGLPTIGSSIGCCSWLVDPSNHARLVPVGCVGELVIEGPGISRGYLCDEERTKDRFIEDNSWTTDPRVRQYSLPPRSSRRMFKTGDLARYNSDGTLVYLGRKDEAIDLRFQTVALEIERLLEAFTSSDHRYVVEAVDFDNAMKVEKCFAVFVLPEVQSTGTEQETKVIVPKSCACHDVLEKVHSFLSTSLPASRVPSLYFPVQSLPLTPLGKVNRRLLRNTVRALPKDLLREYDIQSFAEFWRLELEKSLLSNVFPQRSLSVHRPSAMKLTDKSILIPWGGALQRSKAKVAAICAWALSIYAYTQCDDVIFGDLLLDGGSDGDVREVCPELAIITPKRVRINDTDSIAGVVNRIDSSLVAAEAFQKAPLHSIRSLNTDTARACNFETLLSVASISAEQQNEYLERLETESKSQAEHHVLSLAVFCVIEEARLQLRARYDDAVLYPSQVERLMALLSEFLDIMKSTADLNGKVPNLAERSESLWNFHDAVDYWKEHLNGLESCLFPALTPKKEQIRFSAETLRLTDAPKIQSTCKSLGVAPKFLLQTVWGLVLRCYTGLEDVCFGYCVSGGGTFDSGTKTKSNKSQTGHFPYRLNLSDELKIRDVIQKRKADTEQALKHQLPIFEIQRAAGFEDSPIFNTAFLYKKFSAGATEFSSTVFNSTDEELNRYLIVVNASISASSGEINFEYQSTSLSGRDIGCIVDCFEHTLNSVLTLLALDSTIRDVEFLGPHSCHKMREWNAALPEKPKRCAHEVIYEQALAQPTAPAIDSWDGSFTYEEVDRLSSRLSHLLSSKGVGPEVFVGLCFEKSAWAVIAQVAVLKAGGVFASLDPAHPESRLKGLVEDIDAPIVLCSAKYLDKTSRISKVALVISERALEQIPDSLPGSTPVLSVTNAAYAIFTSGTTGKPKVTVLEHAALGIASSSFANVLGMGADTRAVQFSSYTFDVSILETVIVLMTGGCVCVPSDEERLNDLTGAIRRMEANLISCTPSVTDTLNPSNVPTLKTIINGGEKLTESHIARWADRIFFNAYGPSEATVIATASRKFDQTGTRLDGDSNSIGTAISGRAWIVDPHNYNRLLPVGAVGELVLEGCNVARGYLNNDKKTKEVFIKEPTWCRIAGLRDVLQHNERMYRTGDLVRYRSDGSICFISRMDTQIKLNGQRIELEEIEQQCALSLPAEDKVAVDVVVPETKTVAKGLAAFFTVGRHEAPGKGPKDGMSANVLLPVSDYSKRTIERLQNSASQSLPSVMIPKFYFPVRYLPLGTTGKLDRKALRAMVQLLSKEQLKPYMISNSSSSQETMDQGTKSTLRGLWGEVLDLEPGSISSEDSFFGIGGDSFAAMKLVGAARSQGISLTVAEVYEHPVLSDMAKHCENVRDSSEKPHLEPFSLIPTSVPFQDILEEVSGQCCVSEDSISDIYPCSAVQEGLLALSIKHRGAYVARPIFQLAANVDLERFKASWQQVVDEIDILRTRIVHTESAGFLQVVLNQERISWTVETTFDDMMEDALESNGGLLTKYAIVQPGPSVRYFAWVVHHALYDGWNIPQALKRVEEIYSGSSTENLTIPYKHFIYHLFKRDLSQSDEFWKSHLDDLSCAPFPPPKNTKSTSVRAGNRQSSSVNILRTPGSVDITIPELIRAAWAIVLSVHTGCGDVCFGETLMGRNIDMPGITDIAGPVLTTVPMRIQVDNILQITKFLHDVRQLTAKLIPHQHSGLQRIRKLSSDAALACDFQNLLVIQSDDGQLDKDIWTMENNQTNGDFFTHSLVVECKISGPQLFLQVHHDELVLDSWHAERLMRQFCFVLEQLLRVPKNSVAKVGDIDVASPLDKHDVARWNQRELTRVDKCVHDIIWERSIVQPQAPAVCSWDGQLTYQEMIDYASSFATYLASYGIGPETLVPICLEKSLWAVITILSVLMAGGAFVPLDPSHPTTRHKEALAETDANIILCSPQYRSRYLGTVGTIIPVSGDTVRAYGTIKAGTRPRVNVTSSNMAYAIFTSGSTGRAKGIIIDHRAVCSSATAFAPVMYLDEDARVFQFASLTFDAAILEVLATLMHGACICIPNEEERLNDIPGAMRRMNVTWTFLTPSIVSILEPSSVPSLKVLSCGGEKMSREVINRWAHRVKLINGYGPTETTIFALLNTDFVNHSFSSIGYGIPSTLTWIVDPDNHDRLTPLGAVGELALEGAALAREYLKNPKKTADAFIIEPAWMKSFPSSLPSPRRIYKTGDLVKYDKDGSVEYIGRKDHQVKLHGQRMELGEIEHRLCEDPRIRHAVVILPKTGPLKEKLVTVLSLNSLLSDSSIISDSTCELVGHKDMREVGHLETGAIQKSLEMQLPIYMVPQVWAVIKRVPMLVSGKLDRKRITGWVEQLDEPTYNLIMQDYDRLTQDDIGQADEDDKSSVIGILRDVFAQVLNIPLAKVDPGRSFISLGGDSISGMAIISKARKLGFNLPLHRLLQSKSLEELALFCSVKPGETNTKEVSSVPFSLAPAQELFFRSTSNPPRSSGRFNQSITVRIMRKLPSNVVEGAIRALVRKHSMFRARFNKSLNGKWQQRITDEVDSSYKFRVHSVKDTRETLHIIANSQCSLDIQTGPVVAADLLNLQDGQQTLFLVASHLVVDMVSWRIVLQDVQEFVDTGSLSAETPLSFQSWCNWQAESSKGAGDSMEILWEPPNLAYWGMTGSPNNYGHVKMETFTLDEQATTVVSRHCHGILRTETVEVLLSAVIHSFGQVFTDRDVPTIYNEGHGRESLDPSIDPSRTVGWFTTLCPLQVRACSDFLDTMKRVKDTRRRIAGISRDFFARNVLRSSGDEETDKFPVPLEILFNYHGQLQQLERDESLFRFHDDVFSGEAFELAGDMGPETPRFGLFEITALIVKERLHVSFAYNRNVRGEGQIQRWVTECKRILEVDLLNLRNVAPEPTLSDFPLLPLRYDGLSELTKTTLPRLGIARWDQVEDIYPCSPVQEGILLSQLRDPDEYIFNAIFEVRHASKDRNVDLARLQKAWSVVIARHPMLRTAFIDSNYKGGSFDQVVVKKVDDAAIEIECDDSCAFDELDTIRLQSSKKSPNHCHQLVICKTSAGRVLVKLEMNHAIIDGGSMDILLRDLSLAYSNRLPAGSGPRFSEYVKFAKAESHGEALAYWRRHLSGVRPCHLPVSSGKIGARQLGSSIMASDHFPELQSFCEKYSITLANLTLAAWAIVLRSFTDSDDVCFGYPSTGRDSPVPGIQDAVGVFINMLCCGVKFRYHQTLLDTSRTVQDNHIKSLPYQRCSLAQIQHELGAERKPLFNTTISIQNRSHVKVDNADISFEYQRAYDPTEYPVTVNVETGKGSEGILLRYWTDAVSESEAAALAQAIAKVFTCFVEDPLRPISELNIGGKPSSPKGPSRTQHANRSMENLTGGKQAMDSTALERLIDNRIRVVINQMQKDGMLASSWVRNHDATMPNDFLQLGEEVDNSRRGIVVAKEKKTPSDSTQILTEDYRTPTDAEKQLWRLWSITLGLPPHPVNYHSSFFKLGGDSITAMKLVGAAREEGVALSVSDVFKKPVFEDMLATVNSRAKPAVSDTPARDEANVTRLVEKKTVLPRSESSQEISILRPVEVNDMSLREAICPKVGVFKGGIVDVLPVTDFQSLSIAASMFESRWMLNYFYLDGKGPLDIRRLRESFLHVVDAFDILRTVFVCYHGQFFQVVLRKIRPDIFVHETDMNLDEYTRSLQQRDRQRPPKQGEQSVRFYVVRKATSDEHRILIRMSHTQYDGVCLPRIMNAIKMGYEGSPVSPAPSFVNYMRLLPGTITPEHYQHWASLLKGSKMTEIVQREVPNTFRHIGGFADKKRTIEIPSTATGNVTIATVMQCAWALTLAKLSAQDDVVFGLTVSGRNAMVPGVENTVGPCLNFIPVRVKFRDHWTALDLFRFLQDQQVANMPYESLGFRDIIKRCTDWPDSTFFTTSVLHQNVDIEYDGQMQLDNNTYRTGGVGVIDNLADLTLVSKSVAGQPNQITISLGYSLKGPIPGTFVSSVLDMVCETAQSFVANPNVALPSPSTLRSLPSQLIEDTTIPSSVASNNNGLIPSSLSNRNLGEILVHSDLLTQIWQKVLPPRPNTGKPHTSFQFDSSFFRLGGDIVNMAQVVWLLEQETGIHVPLEDLLECPTFLGHMAVLALHTTKSDPKVVDITPATSVSGAGSVPVSVAVSINGHETPPLTATKSEQWSALDRARALAKRITRFGGLSTRV